MKWLVPITVAAGAALLGLAFAARRGESAMENPVQNTITAGAIGAVPAIDAAAPAKFETATFAAG